MLEDLTLLPGPGGAISCQFSSLTLNRVTIIDDTTRAGSPQIDCEGGYPLITSCTLVGCSASQSGCISLRDGSHLTMDHTIIARGTQGQAVWCDDGSSALLSCCDLHGNAGGDWIGCVAGQDGVRHNFSLDPLFCGAPDQDLHLRADSPCAAHPGCGLVGSLGIGCDPANVPGTAALPSAFCLGTARPNPFGSKTTIPYELPQASWVKLVIYDVSGRVVRILANEHRPAGRFAAQWDGRGTGGHAMPKGVYFYELRAGTNNAQRRLALLR